MKTACIYHRVDIDGWMSAAIVYHWWNTTSNKKTDQITLLGFQYNDPIPDLSEYDQIIMVDVTFPSEEMEKLFTLLQENFIWIDHHTSAIKKSHDSYYSTAVGLRDVNYAACELTWKYFFGNEIEKFGVTEEQNPVPKLVELFGLYDSWRFDNMKNIIDKLQVLYVQYGAREIIVDFDSAYNMLLQSIGERGRFFYMNFETRGEAIFNHVKRQTENAIRKGFPILIDGKSFRAVNKEVNPKAFMINQLYDGFACYVFDAQQMKFRFSLYSSTVDCSVIATNHGGGGHAGAAGFLMSIDEFKTYINQKNVQG